LLASLTAVPRLLSTVSQVAQARLHQVTRRAARRGELMFGAAVAGIIAFVYALIAATVALAREHGTLTALGVTPGVVEPATLTGTTASFPITGGRADLDLGAGGVTHAGGISLTAGGTVVRLEAFDIRLGAAPQLFASVDGSAEKIAIADLDLRAATPAVDGRRVTVGNVAVRLTQGAADALNAAFGITAIAAGLPLGVATVQASAR